MLVTISGGAHVVARMRSVAHVGSQTETIRLAIGSGSGVTLEHIKNLSQESTGLLSSSVHLTQGADVNHEEIRIELKRGAELQSFIPAIARLRTDVFRDWPYLYEGDPIYEERYLTTYVESPRASVVLARAGDDIIGASTCLPFVDETDNVKAPFVSRGWDPARFFYYGESVLRREFRGRGIGVTFFAEREAHARATSDCDFAIFCGVIRSPDHPACPPDYVPLDEFWMRRGFTRRPDLVCKMSWKEVSTDKETEHELMFWMKSLHGTPLPS